MNLYNLRKLNVQTQPLCYHVATGHATASCKRAAAADAVAAAAVAVAAAAAAAAANRKLFGGKKVVLICNTDGLYKKTIRLYTTLKRMRKENFSTQRVHYANQRQKPFCNSWKYIQNNEVI
jgi:hypothetical protein